MAEYIEREALLAELEDEIDFVSPFYNAEQNQYFTMGLQCAYRDAQRFPAAADVVEVRHGKWIEDGYYDIPCVCSCCGAEAQYISTFEERFDYDWEENLHSTGYEETREYIRTPFCAHCGAKMDGDTNDEL